LGGVLVRAPVQVPVEAGDEHSGADEVAEERDEPVVERVALRDAVDAREDRGGDEEHVGDRR